MFGAFIVPWLTCVQMAFKRLKNGPFQGLYLYPDVTAAQRGKSAVRETLRETFRGTKCDPSQNEMFSLGGHLGGQIVEKYAMIAV